MWGRGSSNSKVAVAIFSHLATRLAAGTEQLHGGLVLLFDLDEHTGRFGGAKRYFECPDAPSDVAEVMIGYPGMDKLVIGGRGVYRTQLHVHGTASHSGGSKPSPNAIDKAAQLIRELAAGRAAHGASEHFPLPGKVTVTAIEGGQGYLVSPDLCTLNIDIRITPTFDDTAASALLNHVIPRVDQHWPDTRPILVQLTTRWPAYTLPAGSRLRTTLLEAAHAFGVDVQAKIAGPSNIGNYLAGCGISATAGFVVTYTGLHATDDASGSTPSPPSKPFTTPPCYPCYPLERISRHVAGMIVIDPEDIGIYVVAPRGSKQVLIEVGTKLWRYDSLSSVRSGNDSRTVSERTGPEGRG